MNGARDSFVKEIGRPYRNQYINRIELICVALFSAATAIVMIPREYATSIAGHESAFSALISAAFATMGGSVALFLATALYLKQLDWYKLDDLDPDGFPQST